MPDTFTLKEICTLITKGTTPTTVGGHFAEHGINFIKSESLAYDGSIDTGKFAFVDLATHQMLKRSQIAEHDILYSIAGVHLGKCGLATAAMLPANTNQAVAILRVDPQKASPAYISYFLRNPKFVQSVLNSVAQSAQPNVNLGDIGRFRVPRLPLSAQIEIADILGSLDDKIELNRRTNETLEAMAQAIFRDWFVDFGPTRRKIDGASDPLAIMGGVVTHPFRAQELADLFPDRLGDNGLPEGWTLGHLEDVLELAYGKALNKKDRRQGSYPVYGSGGIGGWHDTALVQGPSIIVGRKGTVGSLYWEDRDFYPIDTVFFVKSQWPMAYCFYLLQTLGLHNMNTDAAVPGLNRNNAYRCETPIVGPEIIGAFQSIAGHLRQKIAANNEQVRTLANTRDLLLPKLMSGEIRLRDAEKLAEDAA
ncbi:restriction endonuclease subunit S [Pelagibacterium flavum]|uniref:Restriction endonuclease subunit S n=1 Tax=Pelagibacterium flavum TaxID=2984530 RepID=A0ABY6IQH0_9HYPH|nr:restriction endonuclease subunit S [Pelagibacterium sp. YIM 151497]UYQ72865.1 restriction endonuclease subunit S [Pelagibacterium sp. YIM 151497]